MKISCAILAGFLFLSSLHAVEGPVEGEALRFFENKIRPLLATRCYDCHGAKKKKGDLRLDDIGFILAGGSNGPALVKGKPEQSLLISAVHRKDSKLEMPPKEPLSPEEMALLDKWVAMGAPWPSASAQGQAVDEHGFTQEARKQWCFQPLSKATPPTLPGNTWVRNEVDLFVAQKLAEQKLEPAPEADRRELARRLYFDLHGLPPTLEQMDAFANDPDPWAYEKLVDALLASPRYGERWAQHWLDLVRYAESDGYNQDAYRPSAWPYRDWVIKALNTDMPYDRFVREQLAGDEIAPHDPNVLVATSYLRNGIYEYNERDVRGQWELILNDITDTTGELFLGLSFGCARCHNHKFDPILQVDYYRLKAFFSPVLWRSDLKLATPEQEAEYAKKLARWESETQGIHTQMDQIMKQTYADLARKTREKFPADIQAMMVKAPQERTPLEHQLATLADRQLDYARDSFMPLKTLTKVPETKQRYADLEAELQKHPKPTPPLDALVATDAAATAPPTLLKTRTGERDIAPGFLTLLAPGDPFIKPLPHSTGRRTALADWITRPENPLTARVMVNRIWHYHFGRGIVATPSEFGNLGEKPTHPELLDWLTRQFLAGGWSLKKLHRTILLSATYRQTAHCAVPAQALKVDPGNRFLWRFNPRRLDAEQVRDAMLMAGHELDTAMGGPAGDGEESRRSIYTMKKRNNPTELLHSLDAPAGFDSTSERQSTTTPTQALFMVNGDWPLARARSVAAHASSTQDAWLSILGRAPDGREAALAESFIKKVAGPSAAPPTEGGSSAAAGHFAASTPHERLRVHSAEKEGDDFTVEALIQLDNVDANAAVRTIASHWNGGKDSIESFGWSLGVTGEKSRFKTRNLIVQLVGEDENANIAYEVVPSNVHLELHTPYHVAAQVSCTEHTVTFYVKDLSHPEGQLQTVMVKHALRSKLGGGTSELVIGGITQRSHHGFQGRIDACRVVPGIVPADALTENPEHWISTLALWDANHPLNEHLEWAGEEGHRADSASPWRAAMADLCHVLLNSNEFLYLH